MKRFWFLSGWKMLALAVLAVGLLGYLKSLWNVATQIRPRVRRRHNEAADSSMKGA